MSTRSNRISLILRLLPLCLVTLLLSCVQSCSDANDTDFNPGTDTDTDTDTDADTGTDAGTDTDTACEDAGGVEVGGYCWFLGSPGASCTETCTEISGTYNSATASYAGSSGDDTRCNNVLTALGKSGGVTDPPGICDSGGTTAPGLYGVCWRRSTTSQSCDSACSSYGGSNYQIKHYAGSEGSNAGCQEVLDALDPISDTGNVGESVIDGHCSSGGFGCHYNGTRRRCTTPETTTDAIGVNNYLACACNDFNADGKNEGCVWTGSTMYRITETATTPEGANSGWQRACACNIP